MAWVTSSPMTFVCLVLVTCYREISSDVSANFDRMTWVVGTGDGGVARDGCYHDHWHFDYGRRRVLLGDWVVREKAASLGVQTWLALLCRVLQTCPYRSQTFGWMNVCREASLLDSEMPRGEGLQCGTPIWMWSDVFRDFDWCLSDVFDGFFPSTDSDSNHASQLTSLGDPLSLILLNLENPAIHDLYCVPGYPPASMERLVAGGPCLCFGLCFGLCSWLYDRSES
ncbi:hypothetical protein VE03_08113 [Pseudogymnoascus sp. 23342-1-I1]|nr:hypothetical protein VE03_08113 [Pseudogymnoascus sp. 23342-1-I1]